MKRSLKLILVLVLFLTARPGEARVYIDIQAPFARQFLVAVAPLKPLGQAAGGLAAAEDLVKVLMNDLSFPGLFRLLDPRGFLEDPGTMGLTEAETNFATWVKIGAEFLVKGGYASDGRSFSVELRLFDVRRGQLLVGKRYTAGVEDHRLMAHKFADEIMLQITGDKGFFQSKTAFISEGTGHKELYLADFDGFGVQQLTRYRSITLGPTWSPTGQELAFISYKDGQPFIYLFNLETMRSRRLAGYKGLNIAPAFSPDGQTVAATLSLHGNPELYLLNRGGRVIRRLTDSPGIDVSSSFSPDGKQLAFNSDRHGGPQIFILDLATMGVRRLTYRGQYNTTPCWSPRGDRIAYTAMSDSQFNIFTIAPDGSDVQQLTMGQGDNEQPTWSPDGRMLAFSSRREGGSAIYVMTANGGHVKRITSIKGKQTSPSWSGRLGN